MTPALAAYLQEQEADASVPWADVTATHGEPHTLEHHWQSTCPHPACRFHTARARMLSRGPTLVRLVRDAHAALEKILPTTQGHATFMERACREIAIEALARADAMVKEGG